MVASILKIGISRNVNCNKLLAIWLVFQNQVTNKEPVSCNIRLVLNHYIVVSH